MTFNDVYTAINDGKYKPTCELVPNKLPDNYIQDENMSVVWNRQYVEESRQHRAEIIKRNKQAESDAAKAFENDLAQAIQEEYSLNEKQAQYIVSRGYDMGHSAGYRAVVSCASELADDYTNIKARESEGN